MKDTRTSSSLSKPSEPSSITQPHALPVWPWHLPSSATGDEGGDAGSEDTDEPGDHSSSSSSAFGASPPPRGRAGEGARSRSSTSTGST